ncbi:MAG: hypothetical protein AAFQ98_01085 [Bacteroidota bacterium]
MMKLTSIFHPLASSEKALIQGGTYTDPVTGIEYGTIRPQGKG